MVTMFRFPHCLLAVAVPFLSAGPVLANWQPMAEPNQWREVRSSLIEAGKLNKAPWIFLEALDTEKVQAAEYMLNPSANKGYVTFQGALLLRRNLQKEWTVRLIEMRALCSKGVLERRDSEGVWQSYPGRPGTLGKVQWICDQP